jgi:hypothetical protein
MAVSAVFTSKEVLTPLRLSSTHYSPLLEVTPKGTGEVITAIAEAASLELEGLGVGSGNRF